MSALNKPWLTELYIEIKLLPIMRLAEKWNKVLLIRNQARWRYRHAVPYRMARFSQSGLRSVFFGAFFGFTDSVLERLEDSK